VKANIEGVYDGDFYNGQAIEDRRRDSNKCALGRVGGRMPSIFANFIIVLVSVFARCLGP
jgi:hypothetical protein